MVWKPHATVAAVIERNGQFLLVEERTVQGIGYNQPAGHLEPQESLLEAVIRETLEETAYHFIPKGVLGIYQWSPLQKPDYAYLRIAFVGEIIEPRENFALDKGIIRAEWFDLPTIHALKAQHRTPLVLACINDYLRGQYFPLTLLNYFEGSQRA